MEELCEAGFSAITATVFVYRANTMSASSLLMHEVPLTFREEAREDTSTHNPPWARGSLLFFFWYIILLCLTWSPLTVSLLLVSFGSGSYSNPFLHASDRLILSLLSCCSTWQRIMLGTPFAFQVIHNLCTFFFLQEPIKPNSPGFLVCSQNPGGKSNLCLTCCQYLSATWPFNSPAPSL